MTIWNTRITEELERYLLELSDKFPQRVLDVYRSAYDFDEYYMQISVLQATILRFLVRSFSVRSVLEVGTFVGFSAAVLYDSLPSGGEITTYESNKNYYSVAAKNFDRIRVDDKTITAHLNDAITITKSEENLAASIDLFFLDGDKNNYPEYVKWAIANLRTGALLVVDNSLFKGGVISSESSLGKQIHLANRMIYESNRFHHCFLPVGDCMLVASAL